MLFWILIIVAVGFTAWTIYDEWVEFLPLFMSGASIVAAVISVIVLISCHIGIDGAIASNEVRYETLVYQYENDIYDNDNDLGKRELMKDIQDWNEDLARYQATQDDFWIGIYIPNIYDQFEYIELK